MLFSDFMFPLVCNQHLHLEFDGKKFPPTDDFRFSFLAYENQKLKKQKWQYSDNLKLNPHMARLQSIFFFARFFALLFTSEYDSHGLYCSVQTCGPSSQQGFSRDY